METAARAGARWRHRASRGPSGVQSPGPTLLVCSTGGHLAQLHRLAPRLDVVSPDRLWVTFDTPQSRSLLVDEQVHFVRYTGPRDWRNALSNVREAWRILLQVRPSSVISTGSAIAMSFLPLARLRGIPAVYVESAARAAGPSLTGRMLERVPGIHRFTQYPTWANRQWRYLGSVFDEFEVAEAPDDDHPVRSVVVTLGTIPGLGFPRLVQRVREIVPHDVEVHWQVGDTPIDGLGLKSVRDMPARELAGLIAEADVVIAHAGIGSALAALDAGKSPILVPRRSRHGEHVDDHQVQIAAELTRAGLALSRDADTLTVGDLEEISRRSVLHRPGGKMTTGIASARYRAPSVD